MALLVDKNVFPLYKIFFFLLGCKSLHIPKRCRVTRKASESLYYPMKKSQPQTRDTFTKLLCEQEIKLHPATKPLEFAAMANITQINTL